MKIDKIYAAYLSSEGICTDSRILQKGQFFVALKGERFDANEFIDDVVMKEPTLILSTRDHESELVCTVDDTLEALVDLARYHRDQLSIPIIGITGSNGKTTTKELVAAVLSTKFSCFATRGNYNNHIGVPLSVLSIALDDEIAIIEMGANHGGEIAHLCSISKPTHGVITNIGKAHLEGFGSLDGVKKAKGELYDYLASTDGTIFFDEQSSILSTILPESTNNLGYGSKLEVLEAFPSLHLSIEERTYDSQLTGAYNATNIACAERIGVFFDVAHSDIAQAISSYLPQNKRSQVLKQDSNTIIVDCYNANPMSMAESIRNLEAVDEQFKIAILGDMLELGEYSENEHGKIIKMLQKSSTDAVYLVGEEFLKLKAPFPTYANVESLKQEHPLKSINNALILLKGSRGIQLEKYLECK